MGTADLAGVLQGFLLPGGSPFGKQWKSAWLGTANHSVPTFIWGSLSLVPQNLISVQSFCNGAIGRILGSSAVENSTEVECGGVPAGAMGAAYGSFSILDDSAVHCCSQTETTSIHTLEASENGKLPVEWTWLGIFVSSYSIFICSQISFASA